MRSKSRFPQMDPHDPAINPVQYQIQNPMIDGPVYQLPAVQELIYKQQKLNREIPGMVFPSVYDFYPPEDIEKQKKLYNNKYF